MGIFKFVKDAGAKIFKRGPSEEDQRQEGLDEMAKGNALVRMVLDLGLAIEDLRVSYDNGVATVSGTTETQADKEKVILAIGNSQGVAEVDDRIEVVTPEPEATMYTVVSGDSLSKIALAHYGDAMKYPMIFEANRPMLEDPDKIYPGQVLRIPPLTPAVSRGVGGGDGGGSGGGGGM
ncbi:MAG: peptidoglycan-binding protein LysM [Gemmatimonadota bacterium]